MPRKAGASKVLRHEVGYTIGQIALAVPRKWRGKAFANLRAYVIDHLGQRDQSPDKLAGGISITCRDHVHSPLKALDCADVAAECVGGSLPKRLLMLQLGIVLAPPFVTIPQVEHELLLVFLRVVDEARKAIETSLFEPMEHHVESSALFTDK